ncbi:hypothetical protein [uncultured Psychrobacter sp.]|uniref:hypothetical protein n=1 Tax=uncultured Psychrobacter sp. TaxID=259303 RepID=UPI003457FC0C
MNKMLPVILSSCLLYGCVSSAQPYKTGLLNEEIEFDQFDHGIEKRDLPTGVFTYYNDPKAIVPAIKVTLVGMFILKEDCLLFKSANTSRTPIFPVEYTRYKKGDTEVYLDGVSIPLGKEIEINGFPGKLDRTREFVTKGSDNCLLEDRLLVKPFSYARPNIREW